MQRYICSEDADAVPDRCRCTGAPSGGAITASTHRPRQGDQLQPPRGAQDEAKPTDGSVSGGASLEPARSSPFPSGGGGQSSQRPKADLGSSYLGSVIWGTAWLAPGSCVRARSLGSLLKRSRTDRSSRSAAGGGRGLMRLGCGAVEPLDRITYSVASYREEVIYIYIYTRAGSPARHPTS